MWKEVVEDVVQIIHEGGFANLVIQHRIETFKEIEKKLYTKIVYGVVENQKWLDFLLKPYTTGKRFKPFYKSTLRVGVYCLTYLHLANHYIVNSLVEMVKKKDYKASKAINVILRNYVKENRLLSATDELNRLSQVEKESILYNIDKDILLLLQSEYPNEYLKILKSEEETYNLYRINYLKCQNLDVESFLEAESIWYQREEEKLITKVSLLPTTLYQNAWIVPQDASSMMVAKWVNPPKHSKVLDVCAAPGSKSFHMATLMENTGKIVSCDIYSHKLKLLDNEAKRLGIQNIHPTLADATNFDYEETYPYVLVDAPCSGMGTMKHKADLKLRLTKEKVEGIIQLQATILNHIAKYVEINGTLVYSTCTIHKGENEHQIQTFLDTHQEFEKIDEITLLPTAQNDGFYICKMKKKGKLA